MVSKVTPIAGSHAQHDSHSTGLDNFRAVVLLCLPTIIGTGFFVTGVIVSKIFGPGNAPDPFRDLTAGDHVEMAIGFTLFLTCYVGAAFGPILLPLAAQQAFALTRVTGARARRAIWAWTFVGLAAVSTALFWGWLITLDIFV